MHPPKAVLFAATGGRLSLPQTHVVLGLAKNAMLGTEESCKLKFFRPSEDRNGMLKPAVYGGGVDNQSDARTFQVFGPLFFYSVQADSNAFFAGRHARLYCR